MRFIVAHNHSKPSSAQGADGGQSFVPVGVGDEDFPVAVGLHGFPSRRTKAMLRPVEYMNPFIYPLLSGVSKSILYATAVPLCTVNSLST